MKKMSQSIPFIGIVLLAMAMLSACATAPQEQPKGDADGQTPGLYKNEEYHFTAEYPEHYVPERLLGDDVFRAVNTNAYKIPVFNVTVADAQAGEALDANVWIESAKKATPGSKRFKILSEEMVTLNDGTPGLLVFYKWTFSDGMTKLQTASMWIIKNGKSISTNATTILGGDTTPDKLKAMVSSIKFF